jgi:hypothetical protein
VNVGFLKLASPDRIPRRALFALELVDPVTGLLAGAEMEVSLPGLRLPRVSSEGRLVWTDFDPPAPRSVSVAGRSRRGIFATFDRHFALPARQPRQPAAHLIRRVNLRPTGLYEPPPGVLAAAGMLIEDAAGRAPVQRAGVRLQLRHSDGATTIGAPRSAWSDERGGFVAVMGDLGFQTPEFSAKPEPRLLGWLRVRRPGLGVRFSGTFPLRNGRLHRLPEPLVWAALALAPP